MTRGCCKRECYCLAQIGRCGGQHLFGRREGALARFRDRLIPAFGINLTRLDALRMKSVNRTVAAQLGGVIAFDWSKEGVVVTLRMSKDRLAH